MLRSAGLRGWWGGGYRGFLRISRSGGRGGGSGWPGPEGCRPFSGRRRGWARRRPAASGCARNSPPPAAPCGRSRPSEEGRSPPRPPARRGPLSRMRPGRRRCRAPAAGCRRGWRFRAARPGCTRGAGRPGGCRRPAAGPRRSGSRRASAAAARPARRGAGCFSRSVRVRSEIRACPHLFDGFLSVPARSARWRIISAATETAISAGVWP